MVQDSEETMTNAEAQRTLIASGEERELRVTDTKRYNDAVARYRA